MRKILLAILILHLFNAAFAQSKLPENNIYVEAGGYGLFGSINYERRLSKEPGFGIHAGVGFYTENAFYLTIPVGINYLFKLNNHNSFIDGGLGVTWANSNRNSVNNTLFSSRDSFTSFIPSVGYRKQTAKNLMFRFGLTPVINNYGFVPWAGIAVGKSF